MSRFRFGFGIGTGLIAYLAVMVMLGVGLRFHHIQHKSFWSDELFTMGLVLYHPLVPEAGQPMLRSASVHTTRPGDSFLTAKAAEQSPPLNDLMEKGTVELFGATEFAARLPAALTACFLLIGVAVLTWRRRGEASGKVLQWVLFLMVFSPALVLYAKDARAYSAGVSFVGLASLLWFLRWQDGTRGWKAPGWGEVGLFTLACYCHYNAAALAALLLPVKPR